MRKDGFKKNKSMEKLIKFLKENSNSMFTYDDWFEYVYKENVNKIKINNNKTIEMIEIYQEFGEIGFPSMGCITETIFECK